MSSNDAENKKDPPIEIPAEVGVSDFLSAIQPERKSARLSSALLNYKRPEGLNLITLGSSWSLDLLARYHNGSRRELIDMYNMVDSMQKRIQDVRNHDLGSFVSWWHLFVSYLIASQEAEEAVLMSWIEGLDGVTIPEDLRKEKRDEVMAKIREMASEFDKIHKLLKRRAPDESMAKIIKSLVHVEPIVDYFETTESLLPELIEKATQAKQARRIERKMAKYIHKHGAPSLRRLHLAILGRAMSPEVRSAYRKLLPLHLRLSSHSYQVQFEKTHVSVVEKLAVLD